jgi:formate dehydrogenase subunit delta
MSETAHEETSAAHEKSAHGGADQLVKMANAIGSFFHAEPDREEAIAGIGNHISKFWTQRMRDKLAAHLKQGNAQLDDLTLEAFHRITAKI